MLWGENFLSSGRKEIMLKNAIQAIPVYVMSLFKLPASVCDDLNKISRNCSWGVDKGKRRTHQKFWNHVTRPKQSGGLGLKDFRLFNQALLARQAWRLIDCLDSLCVRVLKANISLIDTSFGGNVSPGWRSIIHGLELLKKGIVWRVGDGRSIRIQRDSWLPQNHTRSHIIVKRNYRERWMFGFDFRNRDLG